MGTIKDVAQAAGVSIATVSYCFTGSRNVRPETKLKVMHAAQRLHYVPNITARNLRTARSDRIGVILPDISDPYYAELIKRISEQAGPNPYLMNIAFSYQNAQRERELISHLVNEGISGLVLVTCQPANTDFFYNLLENYRIPTVFLDNQPRDIEANYVGFSNQKTMNLFTSQLLDHGYTDIDLICGDTGYSSEEEALHGVRDAFLDHGLPFSSDHVHVTNMTKENAFKATMECCSSGAPHAILATSSQMALGIKEALDIQRLRIPEDVAVASLGNTVWNLSSHLPGILYSKRSAARTSQAILRLLSANIEEGAAFRRQSVYLTDDILSGRIKLPDRCRHRNAPLPGDQPVLNILAPDTASMRALDLLSGCFRTEAHCSVRVTYADISETLRRIEEDLTSTKPHYDLYLYDTPWTQYLAATQNLEDLTAFIRDSDFPADRFYAKFWENASSSEHLYGIPIIGATQILFYRRDLFEKPEIMNQFRERFQAELKPPTTWQKYNQVASFFTRSVNPDSPTLYGTAIAGLQDEYLAPELMIRIWAKGAKIWDKWLNPTLTSRQMSGAFHSMAESFQYAAKDSFSLTAEDVTTLFCEGDAAMIIAFTEYAGEIRSALNSNIISDIGYVAIPEKVSMHAGWNLGINRNCRKKDLAYEYFNWLTRTDIAYYYTILGGQAGIRQPYDNSEIIELYPWMALTKEDTARYYHRLSPPPRRNAEQIPVNAIESILCSTLRKAVRDGMPLSEALAHGQNEMEELFRTHGYL